MEATAHTAPNFTLVAPGLGVSPVTPQNHRKGVDEFDWWRGEGGTTPEKVLLVYQKGVLAVPRSVAADFRIVTRGYYAL